MGRLSVVLPAYNEELMVGKTCRVLHEVLSGAGISYELVLVNDGSKGPYMGRNTKQPEKRIRIFSGVHFSRNFGKEAAVFAGMAQATGDVVAVMDCDLQHPAETLIEMYRQMGRRLPGHRGHQEEPRKREYYSIRSVRDFSMASCPRHYQKVDMQNTSDFKMLDRQSGKHVFFLMPERNMFFRATTSWVGYRTAYVEFEVQRTGSRGIEVVHLAPWSNMHLQISLHLRRLRFSL